MDGGKSNFWPVFLTPAGAGIAIVSFFLPWIQISCLGTSRYSGLDFGGIYWTVFAMAALMLLGFFLLWKLKRLDLLRTVALIAVTASFAVIFYGCLAMSGGKRVLLIHLGPDDVHLKLHAGGYGTIVGYVMAVAGTVLYKKPRGEP